jgi:hypothetical protein
MNNLKKDQDKTFVNYLNNLWSSSKQFTRTSNTILLTSISNKYLQKFKKIIIEKYNFIKNISNFNYTNKLEKKTRLSKNELSNYDFYNTYIAYKNLLCYNKINNKTMNKINKVLLVKKIKDPSKDINNVKNYRFLQVHSKPLKLIDRLWCCRITNIIKNLDTTIFISNLVKGMNDATIIAADNNTRSIENVILIDIEKAFDSCDYTILEELLKSNLSRNSNPIIAENLTKQYMYILKEREIFFDNKKINYQKGLPVGLPSSNLVFSLIIDEIIFRWKNQNEHLFEIGKDFKLNIYVDDIYIKLFNLIIKDSVIITLIDILKMYGFTVNFDKCKADKNLNIKIFGNLEETDMYLGIPFTRDIKTYTDLILKKYKLDKSYKSIYDKLKKDNHPEKKKILGFFNYKFKPLINKYNDNGNQTLISFFEKYLI